MQTMQLDYQNNMLDMVASLNFISQIQHTIYLNQTEQSSFGLIYPTPSHEPTLVNSDLPVANLFSPTSLLVATNKLDINGFLMLRNNNSLKNLILISEICHQQNSCDISPSFTVVPPTVHQALLEDTAIFDMSLCVEKQKIDLQKNLVRDVFFSPAMVDPNENPSLLMSYSSSNDDCYSVLSDTTSSSSLSYQYMKDDDDEIEEFSSDSQDQTLFFYGLDLTGSVIDENDNNNTAKFDGLGTRATSSETIKLASCSRRTKQQQKVILADSTCDVNDDRSNSTHMLLMKKKRKTCNKDISKLTPKNREKLSKSKSSKKALIKNSGNTSINISDAISTWEYKRSDNKYDISTRYLNAETDKFNLSTSPALDGEPRSTCSPSIYQIFSNQNIDWCRYCGTTEGVNWRPGPWGKRTLCNKHGCDYKGYGFACKLPRLDLTSFASETIDKRARPILQSFCAHCQCQESWKENRLVLCDGCPKAFHQKCFCDGQVLTNSFLKSDAAWYCNEECQDNLKRKKIVVELPRKRLPLMRTFKNGTAVTTDTTKTIVRQSPPSSSREH